MAKSTISFSDVPGLSNAKDLLIQAAVFPRKFPHLFTGSRKPSRILLFGPPGTGKSRLARGVAKEAADSTYFSVSVSDLLSKDLGKGETLMKKLFEQARDQKPSVLFIDEIDALCENSKCRTDYEYYELALPQRTTNPSTHELERRVKTELLEGLDQIDVGVLVLGGTSVPWRVDTDVMKRFGKSIYIPLPEFRARVGLFKLWFGTSAHCITETEMEELAQMTEGYSGGDIGRVVQEGLRQPILKTQYAAHFRKVRAPSRDDPNVMVDDLLTPCSPCAPGAMEMSWKFVPGNKPLEPLVTMFDMRRAVEKVKPSTTEDDLRNYERFTEEFGVEG